MYFCVPSYNCSVKAKDKLLNLSLQLSGTTDEIITSQIMLLTESNIAIDIRVAFEFKLLISYD